MLTRLSEPARDMSSTSCEFREAARPCTHAVTIVRCHRGGWTLCADGGFQRLSGHRWGDRNVEQSCSRGPYESVLSIPRLRRCGTGRGRPTRRFIQRYRSPFKYSKGCCLRNRLIEIRLAVLRSISHAILEIRAGDQLLCIVATVTGNF